jgi:DegV family protein with EDD domain
MIVVTDRAADLTAEQLEGLNVHFSPLRIVLDGKTYISGVDLQPDEFYNLLESTESMPTTSLPSPGEFAELYRTVAKKDPEILSIHVSSGLSGTFASAKAGAAMVPEAHVTLWDSMTLSSPLGWQVEAAAQAVKQGWPLERILALLDESRRKVDGMFTLTNLKYLIHGGRISHIAGLVASLLAIKPIIMVDKEHGKYALNGQELTIKRALNKLVDIVSHLSKPGSPLRIQLLRSKGDDGIDYLKEKLDGLFECRWLPSVTVAPVLGAHTGPGMSGLCVGPGDIFAELGI